MTTKIGFCGSHSTGKTTLAKMLHRDTIGSYFVSEIARRHIPGNLKNCETQQKILTDQIKEEVYASIQADIVITDRTVIDNLAYLDNTCPFTARKRAFEIMQNWINTYTVIFFCPIENIPLKDDGFRRTDTTERERIERAIKWYIRVLQQKHIGRFVCLSGSEEKRYETVRRTLYTGDW